MRLRPPAFAIALAAALVVAAPLPAASAASCPHGGELPRSSSDLSQARAAVLCLVNKERTKRGRKAVTRNRLLQKVAVSHSKDMVRRHFFDHTTPSGKTFSDRLEAFDWQGTSAGENIAWGSGELGTPREIVEAWMKSPGHRSNILNSGFRRAGVGVAADAPDEDTDADAATYTMEYDRA